MRSAYRLVASNSAIEEVLIDMGANPERVVVVPNGVSREIVDRASALKDHPAAGRARLTYAGAVGYYQGLDVLLDVAEAMPEIDVYIAGEGPIRGSLESRASVRGLGNVVFTGYLDRDRLFEVYQASSILFAGLRDLPSMEAAFPSKPFEYMATGRPVLYAGSGVAARFLEDSGASVVVEPERADLIVSAVRALLQDRDLWNRLAEEGRRLAADHQREAIMAEAIDHLLGFERKDVSPSVAPSSPST